MAELAQSKEIRMKQLIQQWLNDDIDGEIEFNGRELVLKYFDGQYQVWEDDELVAWTDNSRDFLNVGDFLKI